MNIIFIPELLFDYNDTYHIVKKLFDENTIVLTDPYNYNLLKGQKIELVEDCCAETVKKFQIKKTKKLIAVGGCTVLDVGKMALTDEVICIPTILSTSCISVNRSIVKQHNKNTTSYKSITPSKVIISIPDMLKTPKKWWQSGFGDLFSNISASIDVQHIKKNLDYQTIFEEIPETFEALDWTLNQFEKFDETCVRKLARFLHNSSLQVIKRGNTKFSAGGEHELYYRIIKDYPNKYENKYATHGQIVAAGTLIACKAYSKETESPLYRNMKTAYQKIGLATNFKELKKIGLEKQHLIKCLKEISNHSYLSKIILEENFFLSDFL